MKTHLTVVETEDSEEPKRSCQAKLKEKENDSREKNLSDKEGVKTSYTGVDKIHKFQSQWK